MVKSHQEIIKVNNKGDCAFDCAEIFYNSRAGDTYSVGFIRKHMSHLIRENSDSLASVFQSHPVLMAAFREWFISLYVRQKDINHFVTQDVQMSVKVGNVNDLSQYLDHYNLNMSEAMTLLAELTYWRGADLILSAGAWDIVDPMEGIRNLYANNIHLALMPSLGIVDAIITFSGILHNCRHSRQDIIIFNAMH